MIERTRRGEVITFYSFKGGVGRTMAVANIATLFSQRGRRVLALDFDFEAPGLHRYFLNVRTEPPLHSHTPEGPLPGMLDFFEALHQRLKRSWPLGEGFREFRDPSKTESLASALREVLDAREYTYHVKLGNPNDKTNPACALDFIAAARLDDSYSDAVQRFDWVSFYDKYAEIFPLLADELARRYDVILIDSRTGVSDIGSICTMLLPDKLVLVCSPNEQSLQGALDAGWQSLKARKSLTPPRPLAVFPLLSRVDDSEEQEKRRWIGRTRQMFEEMLGAAYEMESYDLEVYFNRVLVLHKGYYAYGERIAAEEESADTTGSMTGAYRHLLEALECKDALDAQRALEPDRERPIGARSLLLMMNEAESEKLTKQSPNDPFLRLAYAFSLSAKNRLEKASEVWDGIIRDFAENIGLEEQFAVAKALFHKASILVHFNHHEDALAALDDLVRRFADASELPLREEALNALIEKSAILAHLNRSEDSITVCDELLRRFADASKLSLREGVAMALFNKSVALSNLNRFNEAIAVSNELVQRFDGDPAPSLRRYGSDGFNGVGFSLLCLAKQSWQSGDEAYGRALLDQAAAKIQDALKRTPQHPIALGNAGYIAFLQGREDDARALLTRAIQLGGEKIRETELEDADIHPLPQDEAFRALVRSLPAPSAHPSPKR